jgi:lipopolysaccharide transport system permease protein/teichoic acid transport system permease protein
MVLIFWVVFSVGFKVQPLNNVPFVVWLTAGMAAWYVFADIVTGSSNIVVSHSNLIKKVQFYSQILPIVKIFSCYITHAIFLIVLIALIVFQGMPFSWYYFQFLYYLLCLSVLSLGIGWAISALNVFIRDVGQIIAVIIQMGFWATPIFWDINIMPHDLQMIFRLNPMFYIVQGYRDSFIYFLPFWHDPFQTIYFWTVSGITFVVGALVFKRLKPHFADVL